MKILTILGTRPEIIRLSRIIPKLDQVSRHVLIHTGQNFDHNLSDLFFQQLGIRQPDHFMGICNESPGEQIGNIISVSARIFLDMKPDRVLVLGDTNSALSVIMAKRLGIPVFHMEAGNRCYDDRVPEEVNRRIIDHTSDVLMPYTERSRQNLLREGIPSNHIYVTGNPIHEVIRHYDAQIESSEILAQLSLEPDRYFLVTMHRAENVDIEERLRELTTAFDQLQKEYGLPIIVSTHPRTRSRLQGYGLRMENPQVRYLEPFGFFDFITLERNAFCVLTDSGTVQEECAIFGIPNVTIRDVTERPETIEYGCNILSGAERESILSCVRVALGSRGSWQAPPEYMIDNVSDTVIKILLGYYYI